MQILIISNGGYPSDNYQYFRGFVHSRVLSYKEAGFDCEVFTPKSVYKTREFIEAPDNYNYQGIPVKKGSKEELLQRIRELKPDLIAVHFISPSIIWALRKAGMQIPTVVWIHGSEAISWRRRTYDLKFSVISLAYIGWNIFQRRVIRKFVRDAEKLQYIHFVFVSEWDS